MIGAIIARKAIADAFEALNNHDLEKFMSAWSDEATFVYPGEIPQSGTFKGRNAVEGWVKGFFEQFPEIRFVVKDIGVKNIFALGGNNVISAHWDIYLTNRTGREGKNAGVTVITVKGGKVTGAIDYIFDLGDNFKMNWGAK